MTSRELPRAIYSWANLQLGVSIISSGWSTSSGKEPRRRDRRHAATPTPTESESRQGRAGQGRAGATATDCSTRSVHLACDLPQLPRALQRYVTAGGQCGPVLGNRSDRSARWLPVSLLRQCGARLRCTGGPDHTAYLGTRGRHDVLRSSSSSSVVSGSSSTGHLPRCRVRLTV